MSKNAKMKKRAKTGKKFNFISVLFVKDQNELPNQPIAADFDDFDHFAALELIFYKNRCSGHKNKGKIDFYGTTTRVKFFG